MIDVADMSVGVSTLNRPEALARCVDALLAGDRRPSEILVVDQGDDESVAGVLAQRRSAGVPLVHIRQSRRGLSAARNEMLRCARSAVVAVTDDDCVPDRAWLPSLARALSSPPTPVAVTGRVLALGPDTPGTHAVSLRERTEREDFTVPVVPPWQVGTGANCALWRERVLQLGGYDERLGAGSAGHAGEDLELYHRLLAAGSRIRFEPDAVVYHERMSDARRMATRWSYGFGIGALCGLLGRRWDRHSLLILARWSRGVAARFVRTVLAGDLSGMRQACVSLSGTLWGLRYGWRLRTLTSTAMPPRAESDR